jgi:TonB-dependent receptor
MFVAYCEVAYSQDEALGSIRGTVSDEDFGDPLASARITLQETGSFVTSEKTGVFTLDAVPPGVYTLTVAKDGYIREIQRDVIVRSGQVTDASISLEQEIYELDELVVEAQDILGGSEGELIVIRAETASLVDSIGKELFSKAGASDAADALKLVPGATVGADNTPTVRGLGDRYTVTTLNSARVPSSNPVRRSVEIDQFPTSIIESITVNKTFLPSLQGEASGGQVNIVTKSIPDGPILKGSASVGYNSNSTGNENFRTYDSAGEDLAYDIDGSRRNSTETLGTVTTDSSGIITQQYGPLNFGTKAKAPGPDQSYAASFGNSWNLAGDSRLGFLFDISWSRSFDQKTGSTIERRRMANDFGAITQNFTTFDTGTEETSATALLGLGYQLAKGHELNLLLFGNTVAEDTATLRIGNNVSFAAPNRGINVRETTRHRERLLATAQLRGDHTIEGLNDSTVKWAAATSFSQQQDPGATSFEYSATRIVIPIVPPIIIDNTAPNTSLNNSPEIVYQSAEDVSHQFKLDFDGKIDTWNEKKASIRVGPFVEQLERDFDITRYRLVNTGGGLAGVPFFVDPEDQLFSEIFFDPSQNTIGPGGWVFSRSGIAPGNNYNAEQLIHAIYVEGELPLTERLIITGGVRLERTEISAVPEDPDNDGQIQGFFRAGFGEYTGPILQDVDLVTGDIARQDYLPAVSISYEAVDDMFFRVAWSKTIARPTFRELAPVRSFSVDDGDDFLGNPALEVSEIDNYDFRWEWFPRPGSVLAFSGFYKFIDKPIEAIQVGVGETSFESRENYESGDVRGFELEARTRLGVLNEILDDFSIGGNFTLLDSGITYPTTFKDDLESVGAFDPNQTLTGTPEFIVNANFGYNNADTGTSFDVFWNYQGETLISGSGILDGAEALPAVYASPFDTLSLTISQKIGEHLKLSLKAKNILNRQTEIIERLPEAGDRVRTRTRAGVDLSFGISAEW